MLMVDVKRRTLDVDAMMGQNSFVVVTRFQAFGQLNQVVHADRVGFGAPARLLAVSLQECALEMASPVTMMAIQMDQATAMTANRTNQKRTTMIILAEGTGLVGALAGASVA